MSETSTSGTSARTDDELTYPPERSSWIGWIIFAALMLVLLCAVTNLLAIGAYPIWSAILIGVDVCILYAICVHGHEMRPTA